MILDAIWEWALTSFKAFLFSLACGLHLGSMVALEFASRMFQLTKWTRDYVEEWKPCRPAIFDVSASGRENAT